MCTQDVSTHFKHVAHLKTRSMARKLSQRSLNLNPQDEDSQDSVDDVPLLMCSILMLCDLGTSHTHLHNTQNVICSTESHPTWPMSMLYTRGYTGHAAKPFPMHLVWSKRVSSEFFV